MLTLDRLTSDWMMATEIHKLQARLWGIIRRSDARVVVVTSAARSEGKSTTLAYLATALGQFPDRRTLAIDFDLRRPRLSTTVGVAEEGRLGEVLRGERSVEQGIVSTALPGLDLLYPLEKGEDAGLLLNTPRLHEILSFVRPRYDVVLIDSPALLPVQDASFLLPLADGVILVTMAGKTTRSQLTKARELCVGLGTEVLGLVVGNLQEADPEYGNYGSYGY